MATVAEPEVFRGSPAQRFLLHGISWDDYEMMLKIVGDRPIRVNYDRGALELMSPSYRHDRSKTLLGRVIETVTEELEIPCIGVGSTTLRRQLADRGLEPDEAYYLANAGRIVDNEEIDLDADPPPDLCIEIEISRSALDRMGIYAGLNIPEVWRFDGEALRICASRTTAAMPTSPSARACRSCRRAMSSAS